MDKFGKWELIRSLGEGGQGKVSLALDSEKLDLTELKRRINHGCSMQSGTSFREEKDSGAVELAEAILMYGMHESPDYCGALKVIHSTQGNQILKKQLDRMKAEVEALRSASHPSIIPILDSKLDEHWFVMKYFAEGTLADHFTKYRGNFSEALASIRPLIDGVAQLHRLNLVHRDIKPENVFMSSGKMVLGDLGLVFFLDQTRSRVSDTFENVGSRDWMPGWAMGMRIDEIRPSFDVFSLGKLL